MLQDGPFLAVRLYIMIVEKIVTYSLAFFTVKNILVVLLQIYRFFVLACCVDHTTGESIRRRRRPQTERTNSSTSSRGNDVHGLDTPAVSGVSGVVVIEDEEGSEFGDIEDQRSSTRQRSGYSNDAYSRDSLDIYDNTQPEEGIDINRR